MTFATGVLTGVICTFLVSGLVIALGLLTASHRAADQAAEEAIRRAPGAAPLGPSADLNPAVNITAAITPEDLRWKAGDETFCIPTGNGYVYLNRAAAAHYQELLPRINESPEGSHGRAGD